MTLALAPAARQRFIDLARRVPDLLRRARADWKTAPRSVRAIVYGMGLLFVAAFVLSYLGRYGTEAVFAGVIVMGALLAVGALLDFWRIGFRWHAQRVLYGWRALLPGYRIGGLQYRRAFVGTGLAFYSPTLYAGLRAYSAGSKRFQATVRAARRSGAAVVFRKHGLAFGEAMAPVADSDLLSTMTALAEHGRRIGPAEVTRFLELPMDSALAALELGLSYEYAEML